MFDFSTITQWVDELLRSFLPHAAATLVEFILIGLCLLVGYAVIALVLIYVERKVCAFFQCRIGPNRVGPYGTIQSVADMIKMLTKEIIDINHVDRFLFNLAPFVVIIASVLAFGCIPFAKGLHVIDFNVGIFFLIAVSSIGIVGILLAGWASNNKYSLIGAMRSGAQMISYELSIGLSILTVVVFTGSMQPLHDRGRTGRRVVAIQRTYSGLYRVYRLHHRRDSRDEPGSLRLAGGRLGVDRGVPHGVFRYALRVLLPRRILEHVRGCIRGQHPILRRLDAVTRSRLGKFQPNHGLHSFHLLVLRENSRGYIHHHVV